MKLFSVFLLSLYFTFFIAASDDLESVESLTEGREIAPLPQTDERINGYREDYKKPKESLIELPKKYRKKEKPKNEKTELCEETAPLPESVTKPSDKAEKTEQNKNVSHETLPPKAEPKPEQKPQKLEQKPAEKPIEKPLLKPVEKPKPGYYGETFDGLRDGKGKLVLENGDIYEGHWREGRKEGHGIYVYANGIKYNGTWKNDKMDGFGSLIFPDGSSYYGEFEDGAISGNGTFKYADKAEYSGEWKNGKWHGRGRFKLANGREINAIFCDQQIVELINPEEYQE